MITCDNCGAEFEENEEKDVDCIIEYGLCVGCYMERDECVKEDFFPPNETESEGRY